MRSVPNSRKAKSSKKSDVNRETVVVTEKNGFLKYAIILLIVIVGAFVHSPSLSNEFTNYDDDKNVTENADILNISSENIQHFFTKDYMGVYVPITMFSYAVDNKIWGMDAHKFHLTSLLIHLFNILLIYWFVFLLTKRIDCAGITALLFAVHPINVEGIAWITSRSSLLYSFFYLAASISYLYYLKKEEKSYLFFSILLFMFSVLSKNAAVVFSLVLLLIDFYYQRKITAKIILEKVPFFIISIIAGLVTLHIRKDIGQTDMPFTYTVTDRFFMLCYSLCAYVFHSIVPYKLSALYPYPNKSDDLLPVIFYLAPIFILLAVYVIFKLKQFKREIVFGLSFFVINLGLTLNVLLEDGFIANRYAYVPFIGLFFIIGSFFSYLYDNRIKANTILRTTLVVFFTGLILIFSITAYARNGVWKDSFTLWSDVIEKNPEASFAYYGRANYKAASGDFKSAVGDYSNALRLNPKYTPIYYFRGLAEYKVQDYQNAFNDYTQAILLDPNYALAYNERALVLMNFTKDYESAMRDFNRAIKLMPTYSGAYNNRGVLNGMLQKYQDAIADFNKAIENNPYSADAFKNRGYAHMLMGDTVNSCSDFNKAIQLGSKEAAALAQQNCK